MLDPAGVKHLIFIIKGKNFGRKLHFMIYLFSDNSYFTLGLKTLFFSKGHNIQRITEEELVKNHFGETDTLILSVSDLTVMRKVLRCVREIKVIIFLDVRKDFSHFHLGDWTVCAKRDVRILNDLLKSHYYSDAYKQLTLSQKCIILQLSIGKSITQIAQEMGLSDKTVSSHKMSGLFKLGITRTNRMLLAVLYMIISESRYIL